MDSKYKIIIALITLIAIISLVLGLLIVSISISNQGKIKTLGIECSTSSIDWGIIGIGENVNRTVQFRGNGSVPISNMSFIIDNAFPTNLTECINLTWDYGGQTIDENWLSIQFTLTVNNNATNITNFSFDIIVTATE